MVCSPAVATNCWLTDMYAWQQVLQAQNQVIVSPSDRSNLHPLVIPLSAQQSSNGQSDTVYTCLLRQVTLSNSSDQVCRLCQVLFGSKGDSLMLHMSTSTDFRLQSMPVVQMSRGSSHLVLAARNPQEYLHR